MPLKNFLYLVQLEEYDIPRIRKWLSDNPGRIAYEKKGKLKWTTKIRILCVISKAFSIFIKTEQAVIWSLRLIAPVDLLCKSFFVFLAANKLSLFHKDMVVIGLTGSWGKTTAKEKIATILKTKFKTDKTEGNNNTLLGVAKTIFKISLDTEVFVCELAAYKKGDIRTLAKLVNPKIGIITAVGIMHLERFETEENIRQTKMELYEQIRKNGLMIAPVTLKSYFYMGGGEVFFFNHEEEIYFKIGDYFGISRKTVSLALKNFPPIPHRLQINRTDTLTIIDDTYNSNPVGFKKALEILDKTVAKRKILVTPGMIELGNLQFKENKKIGEEAAKVCDWIIIVGETNKQALLDGLKTKNKMSKAIFVKDLEEAKEEMAKLAVPGSAILLENDLPDQYF